MHKNTIEKVKDSFAKVHGNRYDYSNFIEYINNRTKIPIICKEHGLFEQTPYKHVTGSKCQKWVVYQFKF